VTTAPVLKVSQFAGLASDIRYGFRMLSRQRRFASLAILTMALGIGVMTTLFSVTYGVLLKPLPWPEPDRLVRLAETHQGATRDFPWRMTNAAYLPWRDQPSTIESLGAWSRRQATVSGPGDTERISVSATSASLFPLLRANVLIGATFTSEDDAAPLQLGKVILSYGMWQQRFGGNPSALGQSIKLDGKPHVVVGVMPREFAFPDKETRAWTPFYIPPVITSDGKGRSMTMFEAMARLRPGVSPSQAATEATARARSGPDPGMVAIAVFGSNGPAEVSVVPALQAITGDIRTPLIAMLVAVSLLLLTAVANVASLQLARASTRHREIAIRTAIGAGSRRITQQLLVESVLLGLGGGAVGLVFSAALHRWIPAILPSDFPRLDDVTLNWAVAGFATTVTLLTGMLLGVLPAFHLRRFRLVEALMDSGTSSTSSKGTNAPGIRLTIMAGQIAIACTLLIGAGLLMRSFLAMTGADRGYDGSNLLTSRVYMPDFAFTPQRRLEVLDTLLGRAKVLPGVNRIAFTTGLPMSGSETLSGFTMKSLRPPVGAEIQVSALRSVVTEDYFDAIGMRVAEGRAFNSGDMATSGKVVIVSRSFARQYLSEKPIGDRISNFARGDNQLYEVVGIVDDVVKRGLTDPAQPEIYSLNRQMTSSTFNPDGGSLVLRTAGNPSSIIEPLRSVARELDSSMSFGSLLTMEERISTSLARPRLYAMLLGTFAVSALVVAGVGLFGVLSYSVAQRTREIAVRTALGATPSDVVRLVLRQGLFVTLVGIGIGVVVSFALIRYLTTLLYGVSPLDWPTFTVAPLTIIIVSVTACLLPALRASRIDPLVGMRT